MASPLGHALAGAALYAVLAPPAARGLDWLTLDRTGEAFAEAALLGLPGLLLCASRLRRRPRVRGAAVPVGS